MPVRIINLSLTEQELNGLVALLDHGVKAAGRPFVRIAAVLDIKIEQAVAAFNKQTAAEAAAEAEGRAAADVAKASGKPEGGQESATLPRLPKGLARPKAANGNGAANA